MNCPVCNVPLIAAEREKIEVDCCISCRGLWFDSGELHLLGEKLQIPLDPAILAAGDVTTSEKRRACPRCGKPMHKSALAGQMRVVVDRCPSEEGLWFDARELGVFIDHAAEQHGAATPVATFLGEMFGRRS